MGFASTTVSPVHSPDAVDGQDLVAALRPGPGPHRAPRGRRAAPDTLARPPPSASAAGTVGPKEVRHVRRTRRRLALWRYEIIVPLLGLEEAPRGSLKAALGRLAARTYQHPDHGPVRLAWGTLEGWLYDYRTHGLEGLEPSARNDRGKSRRLDDALAEAIEALATERPELDGRALLAELRVAEPERSLPSLSTLYRFLRSRGLDQRRAPVRRDHRAYAFDLAGDCWQGDILFGPSLPTPDGRRARTYLFAILDDATRLVAHAQFYFEQHLRSLKDCLKQALLKRGVPRRLYFDNGKVFRSRLLLLVAARLGLHLLHTRPYQPQGRAKLERWFGSVRRGFLRRLDVDRLQGIDALNRLLFAWIEGEYHVTAHRGLDGERPVDRWLRLSDGIRPLPRDVDLDELFLDQTSRRVAKDGTFTLDGKTFEAGPRFIGQRIDVRFDPFDLRRVFLLAPDGTRLDAFPVDLSGNRRVRRRSGPDGAPPATTPLRSLEVLADQIDPRPTPSRNSSDEDPDQ
jgi:transposase InsO family protein